MKLEEVKSALENLDTIAFQLPNGDLVPNHFHVTEVGKITKHFIDCGGTVRNEEETDCLARDKCGIPAEKPQVKISELQNSGCVPGSGCC